MTSARGHRFLNVSLVLRETPRRNLARMNVSIGPSGAPNVDFFFNNFLKLISRTTLGTLFLHLKLSMPLIQYSPLYTVRDVSHTLVAY